MNNLKQLRREFYAAGKYGEKFSLNFLIFMVKKNLQPTDNKHKKIKEMEAVSDAYRCV